MKTDLIDPASFVEALGARGVDFFAGVPDSLLKDFCACLTDRLGADRHVIAANEGSAVGMACGYHIATGKYGAVYLQNSGEGNVVNPLLSIADPDVYSIPLLLIIGWRGEPGVHDEPQHVKQGEVTCALLDAMDIPYEVLDASCWEGQLARTVDMMEAGSRPVALVVRKGTFGPHPFTPADNGAPLLREEALAAILEGLPREDMIVSTTGKASRELFELREARGEGHAHDFLTVGGMGHACSIAYGMALGGQRKVWCIDGDGAFIMHMGALACVGSALPENYRYIVNVNGAHESVGGQPTVGLAIDVPAILRAYGFATVFEESTAAGITAAVEAMVDLPKSALVMTTRMGSRPDLGRPTTSPVDNKRAMMEECGKGSVAFPHLGKGEAR